MAVALGRVLLPRPGSHAAVEITKTPFSFQSLQEEQFSQVAWTYWSLGTLLPSLFSLPHMPDIASQGMNTFCTVSAERCEDCHCFFPFLGWGFPHIHSQQNASVSRQRCFHRL